MAVLAHGDERHLREERALSFPRAVGALHPALRDELEIGQPVTPPAEVPEGEPEERDTQTGVRNPLAEARKPEVRRFAKMIDVKQPLESPLLDAKLAEVKVSRIVFAALPLEPVIESGREQ
jgi:hypothetical protein